MNCWCPVSLKVQTAQNNVSIACIKRDSVIGSAATPRDDVTQSAYRTGVHENATIVPAHVEAHTLRSRRECGRSIMPVGSMQH